MIRSSSPVVLLGIRAATPPAVITALYLLFAGHNQPGGGFSAGLVLGAVIALRTAAGLQRPAHATGITAIGIVVVCVTAMAPMLLGNPLLDQQVVSRTVPLLGKVKTGTALAFDVGVTAIVVGLVIALLDGLGIDELADPTPGAAASDGTQPTGPSNERGSS